MRVWLWLASRWLPEWLLRRELGRVNELTTSALDALLMQHAPQSLSRLAADPETGSRRASAAECRAAMAAAHVRRVEALAEAVGREEAVRLGREALFEVGLRLGQDVRRRLGLRVCGGEAELAELLCAARLLYRVLGIQFTVEGPALDAAPAQGGTPVEATMRVHRCALAEHYTELTCAVLSATDEGVVQGLNPRVTMAFTACLTSGAPYCLARLRFGTAGFASAHDEKDMWMSAEAKEAGPAPK